MTNQVYRFDFTLWKADTINHIDVCDALAATCKKWVFQMEKGEERKGVHYQGRISLAKKQRLPEVVELYSDTALKGAHWSPTHVKGKAAWSYVMKTATRVKGPWTDESEWKEKPMPAELKRVNTLHKWQQEVVDDCKQEEEVQRKINVIVDLAGGAGKGTLRKYLEYHKIAKVLPAVKDARDILAWAMKWPSRAYVMDIPRDAGTTKLRTEMWKALESLKDGRAWEVRYTPQDVQMEYDPHIWIFTNEKPPIAAFSHDRWQMWCIDPDEKELIPYSDKVAENIALEIKMRRKEEEKQKAPISERKATLFSKWDTSVGGAPPPSALRALPPVMGGPPLEAAPRRVGDSEQ